MRSLSRTTVESFWDELEKIAAIDTVELLHRVRRAPGVSMRQGASVGLQGAAAGGGGITIPTEQVVDPLVASRIAPYRQGLDRVGEMAQGLPSPLQGPASSYVEGARRGLGNMEAAARAQAGGMAAMHGGQIAVDPEMAANVMAGMGGAPAPSRMAETGAMGAAVGAHELAERKYMTKQRPSQGRLHALYSHMDPRVLVEEKNLRDALTGPGADYVRKSMGAARSASGEDAHMRALMQEAFGDRAGQFWDEGRMNRGMRNALGRRLEADPGLIERALARSGGGPGLAQKVKSQAGAARAMIPVLQRRGQLPKSRSGLARKVFRSLTRKMRRG